MSIFTITYVFIRFEILRVILAQHSLAVQSKLAPRVYTKSGEKRKTYPKALINPTRETKRVELVSTLFWYMKEQIGIGTRTEPYTAEGHK